jgi:hypothetical protein
MASVFIKKTTVPKKTAGMIDLREVVVYRGIRVSNRFNSCSLVDRFSGKELISSLNMCRSSKW